MEGQEMDVHSQVGTMATATQNHTRLLRVYSTHTRLRPVGPSGAARLTLYCQSREVSSGLNRVKHVSPLQDFSGPLLCECPWCLSKVGEKIQGCPDLPGHRFLLSWDRGSMGNAMATGCGGLCLPRWVAGCPEAQETSALRKTATAQVWL